MPLVVERYWDKEDLNIRLELPQGDSFILARRHLDGSYDLSVNLPWYKGRHSVGAGLCLEEGLMEEEVFSLSESPTYELVALIRKLLPALEKRDKDADLDI